VETNAVTVSLPSLNYDGREHSFNISVQDGILLLTTTNGRKIANINVETMTREVKDDDGEYHTKPSDNFFLRFDAVSRCTKDIAEAWVEEIIVPSAMSDPVGT